MGLVVFDLNGIFVKRTYNENVVDGISPWTMVFRQGIGDFLDRLVASGHELAIFSSVTSKNIKDLVTHDECFGNRPLTFIWDQTHCCLDEKAWPTRKNICRVWKMRSSSSSSSSIKKEEKKSRFYTCKETILIDDSPIKTRSHPKHCILRASFDGTQDEDYFNTMFNDIEALFIVLKNSKIQELMQGHDKCECIIEKRITRSMTLKMK